MTQAIVAGLAMGCIYALVGLSFILIYNATRGLNFAHGELVMLAAFVFSSLLLWGMDYFWAVGATLLVMALFGLLYQRLLFYPLRNRPPLAFIIATIGFGLFARNFALVVWGSDPRRVRSLLGDELFRVGGVVLPPENLIIIVVTLMVLAAQYGIFFHTDLGRRLRAAAQENPEMAQLLGIRLTHMIALTFVASAAIAGLAGVLVAPIFLVDTDMGLSLILKAFIAVIIGGFGSIPGAVAGGLIVGVAEVLFAVLVSSAYKDALVFAVLIAFLVVFPRGIFGDRIAERA